MATAIYLLTFLVALATATLLLRSFFRTRERLLLWAGLCFVAFSVSNAVLIVDRLVLPEVDLFIYRHVATLVGVCFMLYGLIWEVR